MEHSRPARGNTSEQNQKQDLMIDLGPYWASAVSRSRLRLAYQVSTVALHNGTGDFVATILFPTGEAISSLALKEADVKAAVQTVVYLINSNL
jgi:hypothetical protein